MLTCKEYVGNFVANLNDLEDWRRDYPDGMSVKDICDNDIADVYLREDDNGELMLCEGGTEVVKISDLAENLNTTYKI